MTLEKSTKLRGPRKVVGVCLSHGLGYELPHTLRSLQGLGWGHPSMSSSTPRWWQGRGTGRSNEVNRYEYITIKEKFLIKLQICDFSKKTEGLVSLGHMAVTG